MNNTPVKASKQVFIGDQYEIKTDARKWLIEVTGLLHRRVDYQTSLSCFLDLTPEEKQPDVKPTAFVFNTGKRKSKQGRPTKKERRRLDDLLD